MERVIVAVFSGTGNAMRAAIFVAIPIATWLLGTFAPAWWGFGRKLGVFGLGLLAYCGLTAIQLGPLNAVIRSLERRPAFRRFFAAGHTRKYRRYLAPGFRPGEAGGSPGSGLK